MTRRHTSLLAVLLGFAALPLLGGAPLASGATGDLVIRGHGNGHGIGLSQWGAHGYAVEGKTYRFILRRYYRGTRLGTVSPRRTVRVLIQSQAASRFRGATRAGTIALSMRRTYRVSRAGDAVVLRDDRGRELLRSSSRIRVRGPKPLTLLGTAAFGVTDGTFRGALEFRASPATANVLAIDALGLDDYVRGVVAGEVPAEWPAQAVRAQAVAARTYAITTDAGGDAGVDQFSDTRSQVFRGVAGEHPRSDAAVRATRGQVVTYRGEPVATFFSAESGGVSAAVEDGFVGSEPKPWLKSVTSPFETDAPLHDWTRRFTRAQVEAKLGDLVRGDFVRIDVLSTGSRRVVRARVVGTDGSRETTGPVLRSRLGLPSTFVTFS